MLDRIKRIIDEERLTASSFADKIQVSRGTISHILNGRNDPSKDTIDKILKTFPDISSSWFLRGEGSMYKRGRMFMRPALSSYSGQPGLFDEKNAVESSGKSYEYEYSQKNEIKKQDNITNQTMIQDVNLLNVHSKKIVEIRIFFNDKTFMTFIPEE